MCHSSNTHSKSGQLATLDYLITHANFRIQSFLALDCTILGNGLVSSWWSVIQHLIPESVPRTRHICFLNFWLDTDQRNTTLQGWFGLFSSLRLNFSYFAWYSIGFLKKVKKWCKSETIWQLLYSVHGVSLVHWEGTSLQINCLSFYHKCWVVLASDLSVAKIRIHELLFLCFIHGSHSSAFGFIWDWHMCRFYLFCNACL